MTTIIQDIEVRMTDVQKENVIKVLNEMVKLSRKDMIRMAINKFR